jgi:phosphohistidine phosphatase
MKTLLILRHAKSSWANANMSDHERPLNERGKQDAPRAGRWLRDQELTPDLIITSSAERALATAEAAALACDYDNEIAVTRDFYHAGSDAYLELLAGVSDEYERVMVVGHNPGMEELVEQLTGRIETMVTAALAVVQLPINYWQELNDETEGKVVEMWRPADST